MQKRITLALSLVLCLAVSSAYSQAKKPMQGKVSGKVIESSNGQAVEYATVALLKVTDSSMVNGTVTGANGNFMINNVPLGKYILRVSFMGYETYYHPQTLQLTQKKANVNVGKIELKTNATTLQEARVVAERSMVEYKLDKRVVNVDKNIVTGGGTATDVLENVPSVTVDNDGNVSLRGSANVKVLIDGKPYELMGSDLSSLLEQIPATTIENVEVITNPSAKYDPEGMSGIINIKLKERSSSALGLNGVVNLNVGTPFALLGSNYPSDILPSIIPTTMGSVNLNYSTEKYNIF
ncbi:MAG: TonB-dependent receptor, partial [Bacteroidales bacterium]|nr:TonB-dependent receptor [Bacteroidales bacterium]